MELLWMKKSFPTTPQKTDRYDEGEEKWEDEEQDHTVSKSFPDLEEKVKAVIAKFDGEVFPKLNWSSPKDATWMNTFGTIRCCTPSEVFLLLKSSDFVSNDISHAFDNCIDHQLTKPPKFYLVLRKWYDLKPSMEFRCFVKSNTLLGMYELDFNNYII